MTGAAMKVRYRFVVEDRDRHGNNRVYFRCGKANKIRITELPGTPAFAARHAALVVQFENGTLPVPEPSRRVPVGTFEWLVNQYHSSAAFAALDKRLTQRRRVLLLQTMLSEPVFSGSPETFRGFPVDRINLKALEVLRDRRSQHPGAANNRVKALRGLFKWARAAHHIAADPSLNLSKLAVVSEGHHSWTLDEIAQFEVRHPLGSKAHLALQLILYTGARRSDAHRLGRQNETRGALRWTAHKNRNRHPVVVEVPILPPLAAAIAASETGDLVYLVNEWGKPFSIEGFGAWFGKRCDEAGLPHCTAHGLRKASATRLAEAGATTHQLMAIFGWRSVSQAELYTRAAARRTMAASGMGLLVDERASETIVEQEKSHRTAQVGQIEQKAK
jgi:integrase